VLSPHLQSIGSDYRHGANFATLASTVLLPDRKKMQDASISTSIQ
jgi:hypothetical protein